MGELGPTAPDDRDDDRIDVATSGCSGTAGALGFAFEVDRERAGDEKAECSRLV